MPLKKHRKDSLDIVEIMGTKKVAILGLVLFLASILLLTVDHPFAELVDQLACGPAHADVQGCAHPLPTSMMPRPCPC